MGKSYFELLKDPRWQKKRLEVLQSCNWECQNCGAKDKELQVHHGAYLKNKKPWEYPVKMLHCLCEICHESSSLDMEEFKAVLATVSPYRIELVTTILEAHKNQESKWHISRAIAAFCILTGLKEFPFKGSEED